MLAHALARNSLEIEQSFVHGAASYSYVLFVLDHIRAIARPCASGVRPVG